MDLAGDGIEARGFQGTLIWLYFSVHRVRERELERHFEYYGRINRIEIKKNFAFIQVRFVRLMPSVTREGEERLGMER